MGRQWAALVVAAGLMAGAVAATAQSARPIDVEVRRAWVREASEGQASTAAYFVLENRSPSPVTLVGVSSPAAATAEFHVMQHTPSPGAASPGAPIGGMMRMMPVAEIVVPARGTVEFKPGSYHVMLFGVTSALTVGGRVDLTVRFAGGATRTVTAAIGSRAAVSAPVP